MGRCAVIAQNYLDGRAIDGLIIFIFFVAVGPIKRGVIENDDLEELSEKLGYSWKSLARQLDFQESEIDGFHKDNEEYAKKALSMLEKWKTRNGPDATYDMMYRALSHIFVGSKLAEEICCHVSEEVSSFSCFCCFNFYWLF